MHLYTHRKATARVETYLSCFVEVDILMVLLIFRLWQVYFVQAGQRYPVCIYFREANSVRARISSRSRCEMDEAQSDDGKSY